MGVGSPGEGLIPSAPPAPRPTKSLGSQRRRASWLVLSMMLVQACSDERPPPASCAITIEDALNQLGAVPSPFYPGLPEAQVFPDNGRAAEGLTGRVVDITPLNRDVHAVARWYFDPSFCGLTGGPAEFGPPAPGAAEAGSSTRGFVADLPTPNPGPAVRGLLITGADPGTDEDASTWSQTFEAMGTSLAHEHRPSFARVESALTDACTDATLSTSVIVIMAGRGVAANLAPAVFRPAGATVDGRPPTPVARALFELDVDHFVSYFKIAELLGTLCSGAGLVVIVVDAGGAGSTLREVALQPRVVWQATDLDHLTAPLLAPQGPGLLSATLAPLVRQRAVRQCLGAYPSSSGEPPRLLVPTPAEVSAIWAPPMEQVVDGMRRRRLDELAQGPNTETTLAALLTDDVPSAIFRRSNQLPPGQRCTIDTDCDTIFEGCVANPCGAWRCEAGRCVDTPVAGGDCDDGNPCTTNDRCDDGVCVGEVTGCDDGNACTLDVCDADDGGCQYFPLAGRDVCDDGDACTTGDVCDPDGNCAGTPRNCDDGNTCTADSCDPAIGACDHSPQNNPCDDGNLCTGQDLCASGTCVGVPIACDDGQPCTLDTCDLGSGLCVHTPQALGASCDDGDLCTADDRCDADGSCVGATTACDDGLPCTADVCDPVSGACAYLPAPGTCVTNGVCLQVGQAVPEEPCQRCESTGVIGPAENGLACADDGVTCTDDLCIDGVCSHPNLPGTCQTAESGCVGVGEMISPCLICVATGTGGPIAPSTPCDDGDPCTTEDACNPGGACEGVQEVCCAAAAGPDAQCGETLSGSTTGGTDALSTYTCNGNTFTGPEAIHTFTAPCAGQAVITFSGPPSVFLILVRGDLDTCAEGTCQSATPAGVFPTLEAGEVVTLVVDGINGASGDYTIDIACGCP